MTQHHKINYVELPSQDLDKTKQFFSTVFAWQFEDYGPDYTAFANQGIDGGFFKSALASTTSQGGALIVLYSDNLEHTLGQVKDAGGHIIKPIFDFPGGRRFQFLEPGGNEFAVWSKPLR
ncbi:VOC family protein [Thalassotalea maritima]|uniref:VOC family protein n=1 Tax=Thalassotalea maritima TaxID=3242416 RepID=UPI00352750DD